MILYTSGTTGLPKGAMLAHCNVIHSAMVFVSCLHLTASDRSIAAVPLGHVTGVVANIMTMVRCAGALIIMAEFKAAEYLKVAARERVTYTVMVPAMYNLCLLQPDFDSYDLSSWRIGGFGGAPMPIATIERLDARFSGLKLMNCYGATETTSPSTMMPGELTATNIDSVGLPCPGADISIMDADGRELPRGDIGEIWIRSGSVIKGYWNNPKATAESFTGGYWHSGDLGSIDDENFVRVLDRQKDMINRGGLNIYSAEVESVLSGHPGVVESAIIAEPCPVLGERVHAVIVTRGSGVASGPARLVRRTAVGLQGAGDHGPHLGALAAQRQWQGDEAAAARGFSGDLGRGATVALPRGARVSACLPAAADFARSVPQQRHRRRSWPR